MKKIIAIILAALVLCTALVACGEKKEEPSGQTRETEQTTPEQTTPEQTTPEQTTPEQTTAGGPWLKSDETHAVYLVNDTLIIVEHEGDKVIGYYSETDLEDPELARSAVELMADDLADNIEYLYAVDSYVIIVFKESVYADLTYSAFDQVYAENRID